MIITLTTDGGWLGIADGVAFEAYNDWSGEFDEAWDTLIQQMSDYRALFWEGALIQSANWSVQVELGFAAPALGTRSVVGGLRLNSGKLCLFGWDQMVGLMVDDEATLLSEHLGSPVITLPRGEYRVTVTQLVSPHTLETSEELRLVPTAPHFHLLLTLLTRPSPDGSALPPAWNEVAWLADRWHDRPAVR